METVTVVCVEAHVKVLKPIAVMLFQGPGYIIQYRSLFYFVGDVFHYDIFKAWEFDESFPLRSPVIWYLVCWYPFNLLKLMKMFGVVETMDSYWLLVVPRLMMFLVSVLIDASGLSYISFEILFHGSPK